MNFLIMMGNSVDLNTKFLFGSTHDFRPFNLDINLATDAQKNICDNFFSLVGGSVSINIINSPYDFNDFNYITNSGINIDINSLDYSVLSYNDKNIIDEMVNLINSLTE